MAVDSLPRGLEGKTALITGASRGIGRAIALKLAARGAFVVVHYNRGESEARQVAAEIRALGGQAVTIGADLSVPGIATHLFAASDAALQRELGDARFDILVNNAGIGQRAAIEEVSEEDLDRIMQVNFKAPFFITQHAIPRLRDGGRIINITSRGTRGAIAAMAAYAPSKAALEKLTELLAQQLGPRGITVNSVAPGAIATDMNSVGSDEGAARAIVAVTALRRVGQPDDVADVVAFLASDDARWVTAQRIEASGGQRL